MRAWLNCSTIHGLYRSYVISSEERCEELEERLSIIAPARGTTMISPMHVQERCCCAQNHRRWIYGRRSVVSSCRRLWVQPNCSGESAMADQTLIEWANNTFPPWFGCTVLAETSSDIRCWLFEPI